MDYCAGITIISCIWSVVEDDICLGGAANDKVIMVAVESTPYGTKKDGE